MKTIITILAILLSFALHAQRVKPQTPGDHLAKGATQITAAAVIPLAAAALTLVITQDEMIAESKAGVVLMAGAGLAAVVYYFSGVNNIRKAGKKMNDRGISLSEKGIILHF